MLEIVDEKRIAFRPAVKLSYLPKELQEELFDVVAAEESVFVSLFRQTTNERKCKSLMATVTQDMKYRQSLICYAEKYGVAKVSRKYNRARSTIYFWLSRCDGMIESLANRSKRYFAAYEEQSTYSSADFLKKAICFL